MTTERALDECTLTTYELKVLNAFYSNSVDQLRQGAALNSAAETLIASGYMSRYGDLRDKGFEALGAQSPMKPGRQPLQPRAKVS